MLVEFGVNGVCYFSSGGLRRDIFPERAQPGAKVGFVAGFLSLLVSALVAAGVVQRRRGARG